MSLHDLPALPISSVEELKSSLASQLDNIGSKQEGLVGAVLQDIIQNWQKSREDSMPDALIYPVRRDPTRVGCNLEKSPANVPKIKAELEAKEHTGASFLWEIDSDSGLHRPLLSVGSLDERGLAVCRVLTAIPDLEVFMIRYDQAQDGHGQEGVDYFDILGRLRLNNFDMPNLDTLSSSHTDCDMAFVICRATFFVEYLMLVVQEEESESLRDQILCYLVHHAAENLSLWVLEGVDEAITDGQIHVSAHVANKLLICSILVNDWRVFQTTACSYRSEPSTTLFSVLHKVLVFCSMPMESFELGFIELFLKLFASERLPDVLLAMETPEHATCNPHGCVATFIDRHFYAIETYLGPGEGLLGFQEARLVMRICACYQDGFNRALQLETMFAARVDNGKFCLGLVLHLFKHLDDGSISPQTARSWYQCFRRHGLAHMHICDMKYITEFSKDGTAEVKTGHNVVDNTRKVPGRGPMQKGRASSMFAHMVQLGWHEEAVEFLTEFVLRKLRLDDPDFDGDVFESLWLPFFAEVFSAYRKSKDEKWRQIYPVLRDTFLAVTTIYAVCVVGREPGKGNLRRARLSSRCGCVSCQAVGSFLVDETKTRQLFQVIQKKNSATRELVRRWEAVHSTVTVSRPALGHIVRQLDDVERDCACHIRETKAAGPVLFLQKRDNGRQWRAWHDRREVAKEQMCQLGFLGEILGKQHVVWESLAFLEKASPTELLIPFIMDNAKSEAKTLSGIRQMLREQLGLLRQGRGLTWKMVTVSPEGLTIVWL